MAATIKMSWFVIELTAIVFENYLVLHFFNKVFTPKFAKSKHNLCFGLFLLLLTVNAFCMNQIHFFEGILTFVPICLFAVYALLCLQGNAFQKVLLSLLSMSVIFAINVLTTYLLSFPFGVPDTFFPMESDITRLIGIFLSKILFFIALQMFAVFLKKEQMALRLSEYSISIVLFAITYLVLIALIAVQVGAVYQEELIFFAAIGILATNIIVFLMVKNLSNANKNMMKISLLELQLAQQKSLFQDAAYIGKEIKKSEHDLKHHLRAVLTELEDGNDESAKKYMQTVLHEYETNIFKYILIENSVINSVLNLKIAKCHENNIDIKISVEADFTGFEDTDLCVLLSNLLDNAIEASLCENSAQIVVSIKNQKNYLCIVIKNRIENSVLQRNQELESTKVNKAQHGLGLYSVSQICDKYDGSKNHYEKNGFFVADIYLKRQCVQG